jgi:23S rRNA maturation mini-RNase III
VFKDFTIRRIRLSRNKIADFKTSVRNRHGKIPLIYRQRISKLEQKSTELERRVQEYVIKDQPAWEDFCKLLNYDLKQYENSVNKLTRKSTAITSFKSSPRAIVRASQFFL